jgi:hypothetical protein
VVLKNEQIRAGCIHSNMFLCCTSLHGLSAPGTAQWNNSGQGIAHLFPPLIPDSTTQRKIHCLLGGRRGRYTKDIILELKARLTIGMLNIGQNLKVLEHSLVTVNKTSVPT